MKFQILVPLLVVVFSGSAWREFDFPASFSVSPGSGKSEIGRGVSTVVHESVHVSVL